jgi:hypothetical protein
MDCRFAALCLLPAIVLFAASAGCTSAQTIQGLYTPAAANMTSVATGNTLPAITGSSGHSVGPVTPEIEEQLAGVTAGNAIWREAYRMFLNIKSTDYVHPPYTVDDAAGIYRFDCLGFVDHVLMNADAGGYKVIGKGLNPSIESYAAYFNSLDTTKPDAAGWTRVVRPVDLKPGDVCLWLTPGTLDTGHMWIIAGEPIVNPKRGTEVLVRIFDSSKAHSDDSRTGSAYPLGLGSGILGMMVDGEGNPAGLYWDGGTSPAGERSSTIVCGRLNK